ncbi:MAG: hypothetical protein ACRD5H_18350, partial [Nitrososphaerales archaeon]
MSKKHKKTALKLSYYIVFGLVCFFVAITSYQLYSYYTRKNEIEQFIGFVAKEETRQMLDPLVRKFKDNRKNILQGILEDYGQGRYVDEKVFNSTDRGKGDWILYQGSSQQAADYAALYRVINTPRDIKGDVGHSTETGSNPSDQNKQAAPSDSGANRTSQPAGAENNPPASNQSERACDVDCRKERQVAFLMFTKIIDACGEQCRDYEKYNETLWNYLFSGVNRKSFGVGKIYIATENGLFLYPHSPIKDFDFNERPWWNAARKPDCLDLEYIDSSECKGCEVGLTKVYTDIEAERQITDLNRTIFFKFNRYGREYIMGVDIRLAPEDLKLTTNIKYTIIPIPLLL